MADEPTAPPPALGLPDRLAPWAAVRSLFEPPILNEHKWAKVPSIGADAYILDAEDSVPPAHKLRAREKIVETLLRPEHLAGALVIPRANHLSTRWGREDIVAYARAGVSAIMYPKTESADDIGRVRELLAAHGSDAYVLAVVETARGVLNVESIAAADGVLGLAFGPGDLNADAGLPIYDSAGATNPAMMYPKVRVALAAAASRIPAWGIAYAPNIRDLNEIRRRVCEERDAGFTGCTVFYPPHVPIINEVFGVSTERAQEAAELVRRYEEAQRAGNSAFRTATGEAVLIHQYQEARRVLSRSRR